MVSLGVDVGGTGCKCVAFSEEGEQLALAYEEYPIAVGAQELPVEVLVECVFHTIRQCALQVDEPAVITVSSFGESFVPLDADGNAMTDIVLYFSNSSSAGFNDVVETLGEEKMMQITGLMPDVTYSLAKMLLTPNASKFLFVAGFLCWKLSGIMATDEALACRSLLYDVRKACWSLEILDAAGLRLTQMPQVLPVGTAVGTLLPQVAHALGLPETVQVVLGTHDQIAVALGAGVQTPGEAVDTGGTCECLTPMFAAVPDGDFTKNNFACVPYFGGYVTYAYNVSAGSVVRWYRDTFSCTYDQMNETCPAEPTDLMILPFLQGMGGTPDVDPNACGVIVGLRTEAKLPQIYRAVLEGITYELRYNMEMLAQSGVTVSTLYAAGGSTRSPVWMQIKADILGCPVIPLQTQETGAMGSAILGFAAVTGKPAAQIAKSFCRTAVPVEPNGAHKAIYEKKYCAYKVLRSLYLESRK